MGLKWEKDIKEVPGQPIKHGIKPTQMIQHKRKISKALMGHKNWYKKKALI